MTVGSHPGAAARRISIALRTTGRDATIALGIAALLTAGALVGLGSSLHNSQAKARQGVVGRFSERAKISAALTESLFASLARAAEERNAQRFGGPRVRAATMGAEARRGQLTSLVLVGADGRIVARSPQTPPAITRAIASDPSLLRPIAAGRGYAISDVLALAGSRDTIQFAQPVPAAGGTRVLVSGFAPALLYDFIGGYLAEIPDAARGHAYVLDGHGAVVGGPAGVARTGLGVDEPGLIEAAARAHEGRFGDGRYFAASAVENSGWRVVVTASERELFASVGGAGRWVPWLLLAAFGVVAVVALALVGRVVRGAARLRVSQERFALAAAGANDGIWDRDFVAGDVYFSPRWKAMLGYGEHEIGSVADEWHSRVHPDDLPALRGALEAHVHGDAAYFESEHRMRHRDGTYRWFLTRGVAIRDRDGAPLRMAGSMSEITERKRAEQLMRHAALHDALTGLPNRTLFLERLSSALRRGAGGEDCCAVLFVDLDRFKLINDSFTHAVGDKLLIALGKRLTGVLRPSDTLAHGGGGGDLIARLGGDEFTILLEQLDDPARATEVAGRIHAALQEPFGIGDRELAVSASIGIAVSRPGVTGLELMRNADIAMYDAKRQGAARASLFTDEMHGPIVGRIELEAELRTVIESRLLRVFYQPVVRLATGELAGFEALARWPAGRPAVAPERFVAVAEETGLIADLGRLVLHEACRCLGEWRRRALVGDDVTMSVNVSGRQLSDAQRLVADVRDALCSSGLPPRCLRLEITESTVINRPERARVALDELARLGVRAEIDDFGTGYASLTILRSFPGDTLKVDRSFVGTMHEDDGHEAIVRAIVELAHNLGMNVVAEGIDDPAQLALLRSIGCAYGQGHLFAAAAAARELEPVLVAWGPAAYA